MQKDFALISKTKLKFPYRIIHIFTYLRVILKLYLKWSFEGLNATKNKSYGFDNSQPFI